MPPVSTDPYLAEGYLISIGGVSLDIFLIFIFAFVASLFLGNFVYLVVRQGLEGRVSRSTAKWVLAILPYGVIFAGIYANARYILAFDLTALIASLGILGIVIAISSSQIIQNVLAGDHIPADEDRSPAAVCECGDGAGKAGPSAGMI